MTDFNQMVFLTTDEIKTILKVNVATIHKLIKEGELKAIRVGRQYRVREEDFKAYLEMVKT